MSSAAPSRAGGLAGQTVGIEGLSATLTDVLARIETLGGAVQTERLPPTRTRSSSRRRPVAGEVAATYLRLGSSTFCSASIICCSFWPW